ncbi:MULTISPECIES: hypothetical protein [unclassified Rhizobium]|uniref:hypothetical protein n=1 Tax=unclassified Rhizobium TaxID=2613769 RepID=UPI00178565BD|nr:MULTISPECIES: hypothetical protein [unclassified Rhizobium]MBD8686596.1 hypothetical protein [Rhizobium sp. CFBP 13644]MBD8691602.1 hypothetical protein [Rhizobium sp. CFBP 13717]
MSERQQRVLMGLLIFVILAAFIPAVILGAPRIAHGQTDGDWWRKIIFDFQTLISGIAAVLAAAFTVRQMRLSDDNSERRHRDLVRESKATEGAQETRHQQLFELSLRKDRLLVERATSPHLERLREAQKEMQAVQASLDDFKNHIDQIDYMERNIGTISWPWQRINRVLNNLQFVNAQQLFGGKLSADVTRLEEMDDHVQSVINRVKLQNTPQGMSVAYESWIIENSGRFVAYQKEAIVCLDRICNELTALSAQYVFDWDSITFVKQSEEVAK